MANLHYIPQSEFARILALDCSRKQKAALFATAARINCLAMITQANSGHLGASFSSADILTWLCLYELGPDDVVILSRGHEVPIWYAIQHGLGKLPDDALHTFRQPGGLPGHPEVGTCPGVVCNTGSLGMGISKAKGMVLADRLLGVKRRYFVLVGDGELQEGQNWEAIRHAGELGLHELTVIVDANGYQSDRLVRATGGQDSFESFLWKAAYAGNGHRFHEIGAELAWLLDDTFPPETPHVLWAYTTKGKGVSFMEGENGVDPATGLYRWHSGAPNEEEYKWALQELESGYPSPFEGNGLHALWFLYELGDKDCPCQFVVEVPHTFTPKAPNPLIEAYAQALVELGERNPNVVVLDADLSRDCGLEPFRARFPERFIECGIAEADMVSTASGLALRGFLPIVHSFARFLVHRAQDQIMNQIEEGTKVIYVGSMAGPLPSPGPGKSHQTQIDDGVARAIGLTLWRVASPDDAASALKAAVDVSDRSSYIRIPAVVSSQ